jgi:hypothetical protein
MVSGLFGKKKEGQNFITVFDIGSASVGGAFVLLETGKPPQVIFTTRIAIPFQKELDFQRFFMAMQKTLEDVFIAMKKAGGETAIDHAFCVLASPWYASQTRLVKYRPEKVPFTVTEKLVEELIQREVAAFRSSKLFASSRIDDSLPEIMESKNIQMKLNGYETKKPYGQKTEELRIALYLSMIPPNIMASVQDAIGKFWNTRNVHLNSFSFVAYDIIRDLYPLDSTFLFLDISGELTDVSLVKDGVLTESISFPVGKNMLIRAIMHGKKAPSEVAESDLSLYLEDALVGEHSGKIGEYIDSARKEWLSFFEDGLSKFAEDFPIPPLVFYTGDEDIAPWYKERILEARFSTFTIQEGEFTVRFLGSDVFTKHVAIPEPSFRDPFIALPAMYARKIIDIIRHPHSQ